MPVFRSQSLSNYLYFGQIRMSKVINLRDLSQVFALHKLLDYKFIWEQDFFSQFMSNFGIKKSKIDHFGGFGGS